MDMNYLEIAIIAGVTLLGGMILFIINKLIEKVILEPIQKQKEVIKNIAVALIQHAHLYANPINLNAFSSDSRIREDFMSASNNTRKLSALLTVTSDNISFYCLWERIEWLMPISDISSASKKLILLSNSCGTEGRGASNSDIADEIRDFLRIPKDK